jgi:[ribosomal protein S5]-alanine N-acetyltransferase
LLLRDFRPSDLDPFAAVLADGRTMAPWGGPYDRAQSEVELNNYLAHLSVYGFAPFAVTLHGRLVGDMGLQHLEGGDEVELVYRLSSSVWGRGLALEAGDAALQYGFSVRGLEQIVAVIAEGNARSRRLASRLGFVAGSPGTYYGKRLLRHSVSPEQHRRALAART